ncbi:MAG: translation initiation factor IF-2 [Akkermansia sp.]
MPDEKDNRDPEKDVLDLIGDKPKRHRTPQVKEQTTVPEAAPKPVKKQALDLLSGSKTKARKTAKTAEAALKAAAEPTPVVVAPVPEVPTVEVVPPGGVINLKPPVTVSDLSALMGLKPFRLIKDLMGMGIFANPSTLLDAESVGNLCDVHGFIFEREKREKGGGVKAQVEIAQEPAPVSILKEPKETLKTKIPIITVMGHVDHGKTSLLDYIRNAQVAKGEAGGITQHIGAYSVVHEKKTLTFIDTPGHAIFTEMRARGADITDIIIIVVAANDGIMPQTREAIEHAKAAKKTIIVAINKCDLPAADPLKAKTGLMEQGLVPTDFGGDIECVEISALTGAGIPDLLDLLILQAEVLDLKANPKANCRASIIEARVEQGMGSSATAIIESGTLKVGMPFICGPFSGKVRTLKDDKGKKVRSAGPGAPVEIVGFEETPHVGDEIVEMESERDAKKLAEERQLDLRKERLTTPRKSRMEDIRAMMGKGSQKAELKLYLKGDAQGSVQAIQKAIESIESDKVECTFLHASAGSISESDIQLASSSDAIILGFNVKVESNAVRIIKREGVQVKLYSIVYELIDQVRDAMLGLLEPELRETIVGHAEVKQVFKLNKGKAAGCMAIDGKILRKCEARVLRGKQPIFDGKMSTLRRFQDEVEEVKAGLECGIRLGEFNEYEVDDIIECYTLEKIKQTL